MTKDLIALLSINQAIIELHAILWVQNNMKNEHL